MAKLKFVALTLMGCALGFAASVDVGKVSGPSEFALPFTLAVTLKISEAYARGRRGVRHTRRVARRTARRTTRRFTRRHALPRGCRWRAPYHYCGGVYYQPVVEGGTTVYIVVYP